jgi:hypothetical protein
MRFLILAALPVAALLAQTPPPPPVEETQPKTEAQAEAAPPAQAGKPAKPDAAARAKLLEQMSKLARKAPADLRTSTRVTVLRPGQPCAVPLKNMLRTAPAPPVLDPLPVTPGNPGAVPLKEVAVPAPSCGDVQR